VTLEEPAVLVPAWIAVRIGSALRDALVENRRTGREPEEEIVEACYLLATALQRGGSATSATSAGGGSSDSAPTECSVREAARMLDCSESNVRALCKRLSLGHRKVGRTLLVDVSSVRDRLMRRGR
jgi:hypothetical protein